MSDFAAAARKTVATFGAAVAAVYGVSYAATRDPVRAAAYGTGFIAGVGTLGFIVANSKVFHRGKNGLGSCDTADDVIVSAHGKNKKSLEGKIALVTGANSGIGFETAVSLVKFGATVVLPCRTQAKFDETKAAIVKRLGDEVAGRIVGLLLDLSDLDSVRKCAADFQALGYKKLDILICNAGVMAIPTRESTKQGYEMQVGVCHLAHFLLTGLLINELKASGDARVVAVSSMGHLRAKNLDWLDDPKLELAKYEPWDVYGSAKISNVFFAKELNERYSKHGIRAFSLHPGGIHTGLQSHVETSIAIQWALFTPFFFKSTKQGAATSIFCAVHPKAAENAGEYFVDCNHKKSPKDKWIQDPDVRKKHWEASEKLTGIQY
jgi:NAD(P)-dependent dehydrogenase (short-subunit alcohol dehydrogenase family)